MAGTAGSMQTSGGPSLRRQESRNAKALNEAVGSSICVKGPGHDFASSECPAHLFVNFALAEGLVERPVMGACFKVFLGRRIDVPEKKALWQQLRFA